MKERDKANHFNITYFEFGIWLHLFSKVGYIWESDVGKSSGGNSEQENQEKSW